jgi:glyoxylase-like metal-dependent hydrolase (beta-lactamase superfamily II)
MKLKALSVGQMQSNCYLLWDEESGMALIIDPGDDAEHIIKNILEEELTPVAIVATHGHFDHIMAALELQLAYGIPVYISSEDLFLVKKMRNNAKHFLGTDPGLPPKTENLGGSLEFGNIKLDIIKIPGHTPGSVCLYNEKEKAVFVGDLIFADGYMGRADFSYSDKSELRKSVEKIMKLPKDTMVYPGHGEEFVLSSFNTEK